MQFEDDESGAGSFAADDNFSEGFVYAPETARPFFRMDFGIKRKNGMHR